MKTADNSRSANGAETPTAPLTTPLLKGAGGMAVHKPIPDLSGSVRALFWSFADCSGDGCWQWKRALRGKQKGYGNFRGFYAHRVAYTLVKGPIPDGLTLDHLCRNRACVNPVHLEAVPSRVNTLRGFGITATAIRRTHCKHGHPFSGSNLQFDKNGRRCRACKRASERNRKRYASSAVRTG